MKDWKNKLEQMKIPLLVLGLGILLMLLPTGAGRDREETESDPFPTVLSSIDGVGKNALALSEEGVVVVCEGAEDPAVRLALLQAIRAYTGFTADRISIQKMAE